MDTVIYDDESRRWHVFLDDRNICEKVVTVHMSNDTATRLQGEHHEIGNGILSILKNNVASREISLTDGEKLIIAMMQSLCYSHIRGKPEDCLGELNFLVGAIVSGNYWAIDQQHPFLFLIPLEAKWYLV